MKKLLIIALLFWGCEGFGVFKHSHVGNGICAKRYSGSLGTNYQCYSTWNEKDCIAKELSSKELDYVTYEWFTMSCDEFCDIESSWECTTKSEAP